MNNEMNEEVLEKVAAGVAEDVGDTPHKYSVGQEFHKYEDYCNYTFTVRSIRLRDGVLTYIGPLEQTSSVYKFTNVINSMDFTEEKLEEYFHLG